MAGVEDDIKKDLEMRAAASEELPRPANLKAPGMLDARFTVSYKSAVPDAIRLLTDYFAAYNDRDLAAVARTLHFPYTTFETMEPTVYMTAEEFMRNPPPSIHESTGPASQLRPGTYDIMDTLQLQTYNPVNVGLELCYTRYRADGYKLGINQGICAITNNDGKWGLSGQSSCPRGVNCFGMLRVQRLDQINALKPANLFDSKSLTLKFRSEQIGRFKTANGRNVPYSNQNHLRT